MTMFVMKSIEEELEFQKGKLQTLSIYIDEPKSKEIVKQLQDHNDMMLAGIEQERLQAINQFLWESNHLPLSKSQRLEAIKFNKEHWLEFKHLER